MTSGKTLRLKTKSAKKLSNIKGYFISATVPQLIELDNNMLKEASQGNIRLPKSTKNYKYQFWIAYYQPRTTKITDKNQQTEGAKQHFAIRWKKISIGKQGVKDLSDGVDQTNPLTVKSMRSRNKYLNINSDAFDKDKVIQQGGYFSKAFWSGNTLWGDKDNFMENFDTTTRLVRDKLRESYLLERQSVQAPDLELKRQDAVIIPPVVNSDAAMETFS